LELHLEAFLRVFFGQVSTGASNVSVSGGLASTSSDGISTRGEGPNT
jgi:hypothetical protein